MEMEMDITGVITLSHKNDDGILSAAGFFVYGGSRGRDDVK